MPIHNHYFLNIFVSRYRCMYGALVSCTSVSGYLSPSTCYEYIKREIRKYAPTVLVCQTVSQCQSMAKMFERPKA